MLTFTAQAFTSVQPYLKFYRIPRDTAPAYQGALLRDPGWKGLQLTVLDYAASAFADNARVQPRSWLISKNIGERAYIDIHRDKPSHGKTSRRSSFAHALLGLTAGEPTSWGSTGTWSESGAAGSGRETTTSASCRRRLRESSASTGEIGEATVELMGEPHRVIATFDGDAVDRLRDLDGESLMPVDTVAEAKKMEQMEDLDPRPARQRRH